MRVLIIGGTGNISTATMRELVARGVEVTQVNRERTRSMAAIPAGVRTIVGDRTDYPTFEARMRAEGPRAAGGISPAAVTCYAAARDRLSIG